MPTRGAVAALLLLLAGCLDGPPSLGLQEELVEAPLEPSPAAMARFVGPCDTALLFQFVDYAATDAFLPPGFHPRDPQDFLDLPAATGQASLIVLALGCDGGQAGMASHQATLVGLFVESPVVAGVDAALFDFFTLEAYGPSGDGLLEPLRRARFTAPVADLTFRFEPEPVPQGLDVIAELVDGEGQVLLFGGAVAAPVTVGDGVTRFWFDGPTGLAFLDYETPMDPRVGPGVCQARRGTALAHFAPEAINLPGGALRCPPSEPIVAVFPTPAVNATVGLLPGVRAG